MWCQKVVGYQLSLMVIKSVFEHGYTDGISCNLKGQPLELNWQESLLEWLQYQAMWLHNMLLLAWQWPTTVHHYDKYFTFHNRATWQHHMQNKRLWPLRHLMSHMILLLHIMYNSFLLLLTEHGMCYNQIFLKKWLCRMYVAFTTRIYKNIISWDSLSIDIGSRYSWVVKF